MKRNKKIYYTTLFLTILSILIGFTYKGEDPLTIYVIGVLYFITLLFYIYTFVILRLISFIKDLLEKRRKKHEENEN